MEDVVIHPVFGRVVPAQHRVEQGRDDVQREIEDPVSIQILEGKDKLSKQVSVDCLKDGLRVRFITDMPEETTSKIGVTQDGIEIAVKK